MKTTHHTAQPNSGKQLRTNTQAQTVNSALNGTFAVRGTPDRVGMVICNVNLTSLLFLKFGSPIQQIGGAGGTYDAIQLLPGEKRVMDYICPTEALYLVSNVDGSQVVIEESVLS